MIIPRDYGVAATIDGIPLVARATTDYKANPTLATGDVQVSKDGGAFANIATLPTVTPASGRAVRISLSATEMQASRIVIQFVDQTNPKEWEDQFVIVETIAERIASKVVDTGATSQVFKGDTNLSSTDDFYNGALLVFTNGTLRGIGRRIVDYVGSSSKQFLFTGNAFPATPANSDTFIILGRIE